MVLVAVLLFPLSSALLQQPPTLPAQQTGCAQASVDALTSGAAVGEICAGDDAARLADAAPKGSVGKTRQSEAAAAHYQRAAALASNSTTKVLALKLLVTTYDETHLNEPRQMETVLRELVSLAPD